METSTDSATGVVTKLLVIEMSAETPAMLPAGSRVLYEIAQVVDDAAYLLAKGSIYWKQSLAVEAFADG